MAQTHKPKPPLDVLQGMVNGILIEVGKALRNSEKESGRTFASANNRLKTTIPSAVDNFHQALDDLEIEILRAKAVVLRDYNEKKAARIARENPVKIPEPPVVEETPVPTAPMEQPQNTTNAAALTEKEQVPFPANPQTTEPIRPNQPLSAIPIPPTTPGIQAANQTQVHTPPNTIPQPNTKPVGLGINTEGIIPPNSNPTDTTPAPDTALTAPQSSVNSLFDDNEGENLDSELFGSLDFSQSQTLNFENTNSTQTLDVDSNKQLNDMFGDMGDTSSGGAGAGGGLDLGMAGESNFDGILWDDGDASMADFDDAFFDMK